jgi:hypothetical protein
LPALVVAYPPGSVTFGQQPDQLHDHPPAGSVEQPYPSRYRQRIAPDGVVTTSTPFAAYDVRRTARSDIVVVDRRNSRDIVGCDNEWRCRRIARAIAPCAHSAVTIDHTLGVESAMIYKT